MDNSNKIVEFFQSYIKIATISIISLGWANTVLQVLSLTSSGGLSILSLQLNDFTLKEMNGTIEIPEEVLSFSKYSNGYNIHLGSERRLLQIVPYNEETLFLNNFNISFAFLLVPIVVCLFCFYRLNKFKKENLNLDVTASKESKSVNQLFTLVKHYAASL